ncbi:LytS/YhcK type 5TM receptor domain-containing protein [uncultured Methanoregula sp.]|uniref:LytS/YhcK type 5TM receptor domain-containing protein n=1 Tax=uncultured Methanoregula sp. TaxID=1005933 RepID=UPI002AAB3F59|nr:LytS/YhcK type 5TM receptor domain-containing protein [uncultured Methanoregula sp.]
MAVTLFEEFMLLFQMACVVFLFAYLFSKSSFYTQILEHRASWALQAFLAVVFGLLSVYGMSSGITFYTATVNIRDFGPLAAGLACGPYVGLGAGIIGFIYRLSIGGTNVYAVAIGPLVAGIIGGLIYYYSNQDLVSTKKAVIITAIVESVISAIALVVRILSGDSIETVMAVTVNVAFPMIIMTTIAVGVFCIILHNSINERRVQEEKLKLELEVESRKNLDTIINAIGDPVFVKDRSHHWILVNDGFCRMVGRSREDLIGKTAYDFFPEEQSRQFFEADETVFMTKSSHETESTLMNLNGRDYTVTLKKTYYTDSSGREFIVGIIRDITERKRIEVSIRNLNKRLTMLSSITRHDILNQLMILMGYLKISQGHLKDPVRMQEFIEKEIRSAQTIERQIVFTRDYQDLGASIPSWKNVHQMIQMAKGQLSTAGTITVTVQIPQIEVFADALIEKVFYNLMENSVRHGDHVTAIGFSFEETDHGALITYTDNGTGISFEDKQHLFQRGFGKNTGLGLFLSREILTITSITLDETGEPGKGVRFEIRIPPGGYRFIVPQN